jgi:hypothetical protein
MWVRQFFFRQKLDKKMYNFFQNETDCSEKIVSYGISCKDHDKIIGVNCVEGDSGDLVKVCNKEWCFVDNETCFFSDEPYFRDDQFPDFFYSYSTCAHQNKKVGTAVLNRKIARGKKPIAILGESNPMHSVTDHPDDSLEYLSVKSSAKLSGPIIYFLRQLIKQSGMIDIELIPRPSGGAMRKSEGSNYTAALFDVTTGLAELTASPLWMTEERLKLSKFTIPIYNSKFYLYQPRDGKSSTISDFSTSARNTLKPFEPSLWFVTLGLVTAVGLIGVYISN